ncbi:hypothetical protein C437_15446 [Haloarcula vallismortis ATCC 29715]|uniref:DisA/LigA helix-hairpin-helix motif domain-containing protein n=1 Tax=Haloarcula vallismortis ATCC 29715 TaxID=662477 RepID=M0IY84_HALVA|nr:helix-hairpin-helix domain-containing protein [Haloarcula vallismortis]EMA01827.1 hypothetical protein C437_15446 [Haloarcula vallismortis ATCC 29715]
MNPELWAGVIGAVLTFASIRGSGLSQWVVDRLESNEPELTPVEQVHQAYVEGDLSEAELERRLEVLVDDRARVVRDMADDVDGIGEELSREIAREFDSVADLRAADAGDFRAVDGIGEKRAAKLEERT